ncbi:Flap endonuclease 1 [Histomonas meleagridis]|uniref:Flap endonuclease 1 n=1 Tax=Histomonas meleagridis TaxID=135588 RepID=UPI00355A6F98|nr:Flap endonuclease 1 [Histomonas meleagridis]KAH0803180.1 Flap endonuclease 1 [Histomonas meleagridis]
MGVKNLMKFIEKHAPSAIKKIRIDQLMGKTIAIDASLQIYQFLVSVRHIGNQLVDEEGNTTSHLQGILTRTVNFITNGIKPIYVFDGKPPEVKSAELQKRAERRQEAEAQLEAAIEAGNEEDINRFSRRTVRMDPQQVEECKRLLKCMGIPYVEAPCEAEAECAALCKAGLAEATATEDMDSLAHATPVLIRHIAKPDEIVSISYEKVLEETQLTHEQFIDFCILCGCDYTNTIKNIGPKRAYELIKQHKTIENVVKTIDKNKYPVPDDFDYQSARDMFLHHEVVTEGLVFKWGKPNKEEMIKFLVEEKGFNQGRVESIAQKLIKAKQGGQQTRMDSFFSVMPSAPKKKAQLPPKKAPKSNKK